MVSEWDTRCRGGPRGGVPPGQGAKRVNKAWILLSAKRGWTSIATRVAIERRGQGGRERCRVQRDASDDASGLEYAGLLEGPRLVRLLF